MADYGNVDDNEEAMECPLCTDALDLTERSFKPCPCGYQMCSFCFHRIRDSEGNKCPACRRAYNPDNYVYMQLSTTDFQKTGDKRKAKGRKVDTDNRKNLQNIRVVQRNLVYVTNLSLDVAKEEILRKPEYFGQYGKIAKMVVNRSNVYQGSSVSCYVTYTKQEEAYRCIETVDGCVLNDRTLRASFGTTKYCSYFLRNRPCTNPDCMYLHELGDDKDSFTKEDMQAGKHLSRVPPPATSSNQHQQNSRTHGLPAPRNNLRASMAVPKPAQPTKPVEPTPAWKTQSVGPSQAQFESRKNEMNDSTPQARSARNTAMLMEQYDDEESEEEEDSQSIKDQEELALEDETAFPSLRSSAAPVLRQSASISTPVSLTSSTSNTRTNLTSSAAPNTSQAAVTAPPVTTAPATSPPNTSLPTTTTAAATTTTTTTTTMTTTTTSHGRHQHNNRGHHRDHHHHDDSGSSGSSSSQRSQNSHGKGHWQKDVKPQWQPKAIQKPAAPVGKPDDSADSPQVSPVTVPTPSSQAETLSNASLASSSASISSTSTSTNSAVGPQSPWKSTPSPAPVSISELHRLAAAEETAAKKAQAPPSPSAAATAANAKGSALPSTVSWASSQNTPTQGGSVTPAASTTPATITASKSSEASPALVIAAPSSVATPANPPAATTSHSAPASQPQQSHQHKAHPQKHGKAKAAYVKVQNAPPKEPTFDVSPTPVSYTAPSTTSPTATSTASQSTTTTSVNSATANISSTPAATKATETSLLSSISDNKSTSETSAQSAASVKREVPVDDDDMPPIPLTSSEPSVGGDDTEESGAPFGMPSYLMSAFPGFGMGAPVGTSASSLSSSAISGSSKSVPNSSDLAGSYGIAAFAAGQNAEGAAPAPIGSPRKSRNGASATSMQDHSFAAGDFGSHSLFSGALDGSAVPNLSSDSWSFHSLGSQSGASSPGAWSSFGSSNLFAPLPSGSSMEEEAAARSGNSRSRFAFAQDPQVSGSMPFNRLNGSSGNVGSASVGPRPSQAPSMAMDAPPGLFPPSLASDPIVKPSMASMNPSNVIGGPPGARQHQQQMGELGSPPGLGSTGTSGSLSSSQQQQQMQLQMMQQHMMQQHQQQQKAQGNPVAWGPYGSSWHGFGPRGPFGDASPGWFQSGAAGTQGAADWTSQQQQHMQAMAQAQAHSQSMGVQQGQSILSALSGGNYQAPNMTQQGPNNISSGARYAPPQGWGMPQGYSPMGFADYNGFQSTQPPHTASQQQQQTHMTSSYAKQ